MHVCVHVLAVSLLPHAFMYCPCVLPMFCIPVYACNLLPMLWSCATVNFICITVNYICVIVDVLFWCTTSKTLGGGLLLPPFDVRLPMYDCQCRTANVQLPMYNYQCTTSYRCTTTDVRLLMYKYRCTNADVQMPMYNYRCTTADVPPQAHWVAAVFSGGRLLTKRCRGGSWTPLR